MAFGVKVKIAVDTSSKEEFNNQINGMIKNIKISNKFTVLRKDIDRIIGEVQSGFNDKPQLVLKVKKIDCSAAVKDVQAQLSEMLSSLSVKNGINISGLKDFADGAGTSAGAMRETARAAGEASDNVGKAGAKTAQFTAQLQAAGTIAGGIKGSLSRLSPVSDADVNEISAITKQYEQWNVKVQALKASSTELSAEENESLQQEGLRIKQSITLMHEKIAARKRVGTETSDASNKEIALETEKNRLTTQTISLLGKVQAAQEKWTSARNGVSGGAYASLETYKADLTDLLSKIKTLDPDEIRARLSDINKGFNESSSSIKLAGEATKSFGDKIGGLAAKFTTWFSITRVIMYVVRSIRKIVTNVKDIDTAMTELKKVTSETDEAYSKFLDNASVRASKLGASLSDTIAATADFARLGYSISDASYLSDVALVYKNVGDGIEDVGTASESVISTMKAFGIEAQSAMGIVDEFNEVGNNYAISSAGVGEALVRSASALATANNSLEESIALATAMNATVQDPEKVGTALKTLSMFLRASKTELEDAGESTDGMASSVSELRNELLNLTGGKLDIQLDDDSFKSTYQIMKELSSVWSELSDISQANILELIGGKRNSNAVSSLLSNFSVAESALVTASNSAGSALEENDKYLDSIQGKLSVFQASFQTFSNDFLSSGFMKFIIDTGTVLMNILDYLAKLNLILPITISFLVMIKALNIARAGAKNVTSLFTSLIAEKECTDALKISVASLTQKEQERLITMIELAVASGSLTAAEGAAIVEQITLASTTGAATVANKGFAASMKSVEASIPVWGWIALAVSVVLEVIIGITSAINLSAASVEDLDSNFETLSNTIKSTVNEFQNLHSSAKTTIPRFTELCKGVDEFGNRLIGTNGKMVLTDKEYEEFWELNNKIAEMFPDLDVGIDSNGNHILSLSYSVDTLTESLDALVEAERQAANQKIADTMSDVLKNINDGVRAYEDEKRAIEEESNALKQAYEIVRQYGNKGFSWNTKDKSDRNADRYEADVYKQALDTIGVKYSATQSGFDSTTRVYTTEDIIPTDADWRAVALKYGNDIDGFSKQVENKNKLISQRWKNVIPVIGAWLQTTDSYNLAEDNVQSLLGKVFGNIDYEKIGITDEDKLKEYIQDNFITPITEATPQAQDAMLKLFDSKTQFGNGEILAGEYKDIVDSVIQELEEYGINENTIDTIKLAIDVDGFNEQLELVRGGILGFTDEIGETIDYYNQIIDEIEAKNVDVTKTVFGNIDLNQRKVLEWTDKNLNIYKDAIESWGASADELAGSISTVFGASNNYDGVEIAFSPMLQTSDGAVLLSAETCNKYINTLIDKVRKDDGSWASEDLIALDATGIEIDGRKIQGLIADIGETAIETSGIMHYLGTDGALSSTYKELQSMADSLGISVDDLVAKYSNLSALTAEELKLIYQIINENGSMTVDEFIQKLKEIRSNGLLPGDELRKILSEVNSLKNGLTQLDKIYTDVLDRGDFDYSSILDNEDFAAAFGNLGDSYNNFIQTISNSPNDISACQTAFNSLASAYIQQSGVLDKVTVETKNATVAMLEQMGVANASAIVDDAIAYNKERLAYTSGIYADKTYEEILALYNESEAGSLVQQVLAELAASKLIANQNAIKTSGDIDQLISLANAANATTESLGRLSQAKSLLAKAKYYTDIANNQNTDSMTSHYAGQLANQYTSQAQSIINSGLEYTGSYSPNIFYSGAGGNGGSSGGSGDGKSVDEENWFERQYKDMNHLIEMEQRSVSEYLDWLDSAYKRAYDEGLIDIDGYYQYQEEVFNGLRDLFKDRVSDAEHQIDILSHQEGTSSNVLSIYASLMDDIQKELETCISAGMDENSEYIQWLNSQWWSYYDKVEDMQESAKSNSKSSIDDLVDYRIDMLKKDLENQKDELDDKLDALKDFYDKQKEMLEDEYDEEQYLEEQAEKRKSVTDIQAELAQLKFDDSAWAQKRKLELEAELSDAQKDLDKFEREKALDNATDAIDAEYDKQKKLIDDQIEGISEKLNDPEALFNKALADINNNSEALYNEMLLYNRKYGTGDDTTVKDMWDGAYTDSENYHDTFGSYYNGISVGNYTGYEPKEVAAPNTGATGTGAGTGNGGSEGSGGTTESHIESLAKKGIINSPEYWIKHYGDIQWLNTLIQKLNENTVSDVTGAYTDIGSAIGELSALGVVDRPDYWENACKQLNWLDDFIISATNHIKLPGYANGTRSATRGLHELDEIGSEYLFTSKDGSNYRVLNSGDKVLDAKATNFLYDFAMSGGGIIDNIIAKVFNAAKHIYDNISGSNRITEVRSGDIIIQGNASEKTVSEIRRAQRDDLNYVLKELNKLNK